MLSGEIGELLRERGARLGVERRESLPVCRQKMRELARQQTSEILAAARVPAAGKGVCRYHAVHRGVERALLRGTEWGRHSMFSVGERYWLSSCFEMSALVRT